MLSLLHHMLTSTLKAAAATVLAPALVEVSNAALAANLQYTHVRVSTAKWTPKGNLVVFAGPGVSRDAVKVQGLKGATCTSCLRGVVQVQRVAP